MSSSIGGSLPNLHLNDLGCHVLQRANAAVRPLIPHADRQPHVANLQGGGGVDKAGGNDVAEEDRQKRQTSCIHTDTGKGRAHMAERQPGGWTGRHQLSQQVLSQIQKPGVPSLCPVGSAPRASPKQHAGCLLGTFCAPRAGPGWIRERAQHPQPSLVPEGAFALHLEHPSLVPEGACALHLEHCLLGTFFAP